MELPKITFKSTRNRLGVRSPNPVHSLVGSQRHDPPKESAVVWSDFHDRLTGDDKRKLDSYVVWKILIPICIYTFLRTFRPGNAFIIPYLTKFKDVDETTLNNTYLSFKIGTYLLMTGVFGVVSARFGYKWVFVFELPCQIAARLLFMFGSGGPAFLIGYTAYGVGIGGESILYLYRTTLIQDSHKLLITSICSCTLSTSMFLANLFSQVYVGFGTNFEEPGKFNVMFAISIACVCAALVFGLFCFPGNDESLVSTSRSCSDDVKAAAKCPCSDSAAKTDTDSSATVASEVSTYITVGEFQSKVNAPSWLRSFRKPTSSLKDQCFVCMRVLVSPENGGLEANEASSEKAGLMSEKAISVNDRILPHEAGNYGDKTFCQVLMLFMTQNNGLYWSILWCILIISQYSADSDNSPNWLNVDSNGTYNGLAEAFGSLGAGIGALIPPFIVDKCFEARRMDDRKKHSGHIFVASGATFVAAILHIIQYFFRSMIFLYATYIAYQMVLNIALTIASARLTMA